MKIVLLLGRILYSALFILSSFKSITGQTVGYAASMGVPAASILVPFAGVLALIGGISILIGFKARWGALLIILFLLPVTFFMHAFWTIDDPMKQQMQQASFMSNLALMGAACIIIWFGAGPLSADDARTRIRN